jgi:hypothetical protein
MNKKKLALLIFLVFHFIIIANSIDVVNAANLPFKMSLREHKVYAAYDPVFTFSKPSGSILRMDSTLGSLGTGYMFFTSTRVWLNGKYIRFRWLSETYTHPSPTFTAKIYDGEYVESSDTDFPSGSAMITKGQGLLQTLVSKAGTFAWETQDILVNISGNQSKCTIMFSCNDAWGSAAFYLDIDWIEINGASGGSDNKYIQPMADSVSMGRTGGTGDYGTLGSGVVVGPYLSVSYTTNGVVYRSGTLINNNSIIDIGGDVLLMALPNSNKTFIRWLINGTSFTTNPKTITVIYNTTAWCYFGGFPSLNGNATESDVLWGQTFYNNDYTLKYGTYVAMPPFDFADGNTTEEYVFQGYCFYNNSTEPRYGIYEPQQDTFPIGIGAGIVIGLIVGIMMGKRD